MLNLSKHLGCGVEAWFSDADVDFMLPETGKVFGDSQRQALSQVGIDADQVVTIRQIHGGNVLRVTKDHCYVYAEDVSEADAVITDDPGCVLAVRTADCVPVFLYDPVKRCIGMVHAGWKSTEQEIVCRAVDMMSDVFGVRVEEIKTVFGPAIHCCCYQVSQEICHIFPQEVKRKEDKWFLDLQAVNRRQLMSRGVRDDHISDCGICTCCGDKYFSYRRQGKKAGRHLSLLRIRE